MDIYHELLTTPQLLQILSTNTRQEHSLVDSTDEPLLCYYGDIYRENFPVDSSGSLWVVDFDITGVLPASFASWPLIWILIHSLCTYSEMRVIKST
ncbi:hypothetical protein BDV06DRAFT_208098 [Aspergillus oleicola]